MNTYKVYTIGRETPIIIAASKYELIAPHNREYIFRDDKNREICRIDIAHIITIVTEYAE